MKGKHANSDHYHKNVETLRRIQIFGEDILQYI
jgi:hypothetical protein